MIVALIEGWDQLLPALIVNAPIGAALLYREKMAAKERADERAERMKERESERASLLAMAADAQERLKSGAKECHATQERSSDANFKLAETSSAMRQAFESLSQQVQQNTIAVHQCVNNRGGGGGV